MRTHRWWLALVMAFLVPWPGPHVDAYLPLGLALARVGADSPDAAFWIIAGLLLAVAYGVWWVVLSAMAAWWRRRAHDERNG